MGLANIFSTSFEWSLLFTPHWMWTKRWVSHFGMLSLLTVSQPARTMILLLKLCDTSLPPWSLEDPAGWGTESHVPKMWRKGRRGRLLPEMLEYNFPPLSVATFMWVRLNLPGKIPVLPGHQGPFLGGILLSSQEHMGSDPLITCDPIA